jgi:hypothetical protein
MSGLQFVEAGKITYETNPIGLGGMFHLQLPGRSVYRKDYTALVTDAPRLAAEDEAFLEGMKTWTGSLD